MNCNIKDNGTLGTRQVDWLRGGLQDIRRLTGTNVLDSGFCLYSFLFL